MSSRKKLLLKVIILGDSGYVWAEKKKNAFSRVFFLFSLFFWAVHGPDREGVDRLHPYIFV